MRTAVTAFALLGLLCGSAVAADVGPVSPAGAVPIPDPAMVEIVTAQREVRQALLDATLTQDQMGATFAYLDSFVRQYHRAVELNDDIVQQYTLDEILASKVTPRLQDAALSPAESERVVTLVRRWVGLELTRAEEPTGRLDREVRR